MVAYSTSRHRHGGNGRAGVAVSRSALLRNASGFHQAPVWWHARWLSGPGPSRLCPGRPFGSGARRRPPSEPSAVLTGAARTEIRRRHDLQEQVPGCRPRRSSPPRVGARRCVAARNSACLGGRGQWTDAHLRRTGRTGPRDRGGPCRRGHRQGRRGRAALAEHGPVPRGPLRHHDRGRDGDHTVAAGHMRPRSPSS